MASVNCAAADEWNAPSPGAHEISAPRRRCGPISQAARYQRGCASRQYEKERVPRPGIARVRLHRLWVGVSYDSRPGHFQAGRGKVSLFAVRGPLAYPGPSTEKRRQAVDEAGYRSALNWASATAPSGGQRVHRFAPWPVAIKASKKTVAICLTADNENYFKFLR